MIQTKAEMEHYTMLSTEYIDNKTPLSFLCPKGHIFRVSWNNWSSKYSRCPCHKHGNPQICIEFIQTMFVREGYFLLETKYENAYQKLEYTCPNGHKHNITWDGWQQGQRCPYCNVGKTGCNIKLTLEHIRYNFERENYILLSIEYIDAFGKLDYICPNNHKGSIRWNDWQQGHRCSRCSNHVSKWEKEVKTFISNVGIDYISNDKKVLRNPKTNMSLELDIWIPQLNKAIECNGVYWHSKTMKKNNDLLKIKLCEELGIDLLVLTDNEWFKARKKCEDKIRMFVHKKR